LIPSIRVTGVPYSNDFLSDLEPIRIAES